MKTTVFVFYILGCSLTGFSFETTAANTPHLDVRVRNVRLSDLKEAHLTLIDLIQPGYKVKSYYVTTTDGYILNIHRLWKEGVEKTSGKVVYLQHGVLASSSDWIIAGPKKSLGYILADEGYDIWMGNVRGNTYTRNHTTLDPDKDSKFWDFSWHEMGMIDLPQMIDFVLEQTGAESVYYCGHSQGTTIFYVMTSEKPEYNKKIKVHVSLAPVGFVNHMKSPMLQLLAFWEKPASAILNALGIAEFLPKKSLLSKITEEVCSNSFTQIICINALFTLCGYSPHQMNRTLLPLIMSQTPAGASTRQFLHFAQEISSGHFRQYDHGLWNNLRKYGSFTPPDYNLSEVTTPVYMIYSKNDLLSDKNDVHRLCSSIGNCKGKLLVSDYSFNHLDFCFGVDAHDLVYRKVLSLFLRF